MNFHQIWVRSLFRNYSIQKSRNVISCSNCWQTMGNNDCCSTQTSLQKSILLYHNAEKTTFLVIYYNTKPLLFVLCMYNCTCMLQDCKKIKLHPFENWHKHTDNKQHSYWSWLQYWEIHFIHWLVECGSTSTLRSAYRGRY